MKEASCCLNGPAHPDFLISPAESDLGWPSQLVLEGHGQVIEMPVGQELPSAVYSGIWSRGEGHVYGFQWALKVVESIPRTWSRSLFN